MQLINCNNLTHVLHASVHVFRRALMEQMSVSGIQRQTLDSLQEKLNDLETTLSRERDEHQRAIVSIDRPEWLDSCSICYWIVARWFAFEV